MEAFTPNTARIAEISDASAVDGLWATLLPAPRRQLHSALERLITVTLFPRRKCRPGSTGSSANAVEQPRTVACSMIEYSSCLLVFRQNRRKKNCRFLRSHTTVFKGTYSKSCHPNPMWAIWPMIQVSYSGLKKDLRPIKPGPCRCIYLERWEEDHQAL